VENKIKAFILLEGLEEGFALFDAGTMIAFLETRGLWQSLKRD